MAQDVQLSLKRKRDDQTRPNLQEKRQKLLDSRKRLPIWNRQNDIREAVRDHDVLVLSGETGSGKSTQVPQFLLDRIPGRIAVTQPRRVAAISLARRVAEEMGTPCGSSSPASKVGYSVRFDESTSPSTRIKFLTEGMLLQEMLRDPLMSQYGCIIVDEVHERSINVDLILGFLKRLLMKRRDSKKPLKVVVMSATVDVGSISRFFQKATPKLNASALANDDQLPNDIGEKDSEASWDGLSTDDEEAISRQIRVITCNVEGRQYPVQIFYLHEPANDIFHAAHQRIFQIHCKEPLPGDILVFMSGQGPIQRLQHQVEDFAKQLDTRKFPNILVLPLFAALPQSAQQRIFSPARPNTRKVILSTNLAETSVTVPGVRFVIDPGKSKNRQFRSAIGLDSLLEQPVSRSSADQRKGRAAREAPGQCYRLYTESSFLSLKKDTTPEILRCDLSQAILSIVARGVGVDEILDFPLLTPLPLETVKKALVHLYQLGALNDSGKLSEVGRQIARLPLPPTLGRVIVEAAKQDMDCLLEVIDIVACLNVENIYLNVDTEEAREQANTMRQQLFRRQGDHLTLLAAVQAYTAELADRRRWAEDHLISHRAMQRVMDVRKQLRAQCKASGLLLNSGFDLSEARPASEARSENILRAFLSGFGWSNVAQRSADGSYKTLTGQKTVAIHPSSILFERSGRKPDAIMYDELVYTTKAYARGVSEIQIKWINDTLDVLS